MEGNSYIFDIAESLGPWAWLIGGVILLALELVLPGSFLMWLGMAAVIVGSMSLFVDISWHIAWISFAVLAIVLLLAGRYFFSPNRTVSDRPHLNERGLVMIGRKMTLSEPISDGQGRVKIGDTLWRVQGPDLAAGTRIEVSGTDGSALIVVPIVEAA